jgi:hypothetical protein
MKTTYHLVFHNAERAHAAQRPLRQHGQVSVSEAEDDHEHFYRLSLATKDTPPLPYEIDTIARRFGGTLESIET